MTDATAAAVADFYAWARASLAADTGAQAQACDRRIADGFVRLLARQDGAALAQLFAVSPSPDVYRHLWRNLAQCERSGALARGSLVRLFAIPIVVVAGLDATRAAPRELPGALAETATLATLLVEHGALAGNRTLALGGALVDARTLDLAHLPPLLAATVLDGGTPAQALHLDLAPSPIVVAGASESVHLRFLVGTALAAPDADLFGIGEVGRWSIPFTQQLSAALAAPGVSVLALPRAPAPLVEALRQGRVAQREVTAQIFASNALRELRSRVGEPSAVISIHQQETGAAPFEVRVSLSSPFEPGAAQGLRCPLWPLDRPDDVVAMLATLLADCQVIDVRRKPGVHPDRDPLTGGPLLFKADAAAADSPPH